jgi:hypothetical protein
MTPLADYEEKKSQNADEKPGLDFHYHKFIL